MTIIQTVSRDMFIREFDEFNRSENFTVPARHALFDYLDDLSDDLGEHIELDVIALCCDFTEDSLEDVLDNYSERFDTDVVEELQGDSDALADYIVECLAEHTGMVCKVEQYKGEPTILYQQF